MSKFSDVRIAVEADRPAILSLCRLLHEENGIFPLHEPAVDAILDRALMPSRGGVRDAIVGIVGGNDNPRGCICVAVHNLWYTKAICADELFNFVHPDHRRSNYAKQMIEFAKASADAWGLPLLIGVLSTERTKAKTGLYDRLLPEAGKYYLYRPNNNGGE